MKQPSILLIQLYGNMQPPDAEPLSIEILAAAVYEKYPDAIIDMRTLSVLSGETGVSGILAEIIVGNYLLIGISVPQSTLVLALTLIKRIYNVAPHQTIVLGHALPTAEPEYFLKIFPELLIIRGWGEDAFVELVSQLYTVRRVEHVPNLCLIKENQIIMSSIEWPKKIRQPYRLTPGDYFSRIEASRGCHYDLCTFCSRPPIPNKRRGVWQRRSLDDLYQDVISLRNSNKSQFTFTDEDFIGNDVSGAIQIAQMLKGIQGINFSLSVRADSIVDINSSDSDNRLREQALTMLRDAGLNLIYVGIESLSNSQLKRYGKATGLADNLYAVNTLRKLCIPFEMGFILFDPFLTEEELTENLVILEQHNLWNNVGQLIHYLRPQKDTAYARLLESSGLVTGYEPNTMEFNYIFKRDSIQKIFETCRGWLMDFDSIYLLVRNLERNDRSSDSKYSAVLFQFRQMLFKLLQAVTNIYIMPNKHSLDIVLADFSTERLVTVQNLHKTLADKNLLDETERALAYTCENFLKQWS